MRRFVLSFPRRLSFLLTVVLCLSLVAFLTVSESLTRSCGLRSEKLPSSRSISRLCKPSETPRESFLLELSRSLSDSSLSRCLVLHSGTGAGNGPYIAIHDGFQGPAEFADYLPSADRLIIDSVRRPLLPVLCSSWLTLFIRSLILSTLTSLSTLRSGLKRELSAFSRPVRLPRSD